MIIIQEAMNKIIVERINECLDAGFISDAFNASSIIASLIPVTKERAFEMLMERREKHGKDN